ERTQRHDTGPRYRPPPLGRTAAGTVLPVLPRLLPVLGVLSLFSGLLPVLRRAVLTRLLPVLAGLRPGTLSVLTRLRGGALPVLPRLPVLARLTPRVGRPPGGRIGRALPGAPGMRTPARRLLPVRVVRIRITHRRFSPLRRVRPSSHAPIAPGIRVWTKTAAPPRHRHHPGSLIGTSPAPSPAPPGSQNPPQAAIVTPIPRRR